MISNNNNNNKKMRNNDEMVKIKKKKRETSKVNTTKNMNENDVLVTMALNIIC